MTNRLDAPPETATDPRPHPLDISREPPLGDSPDARPHPLDLAGTTTSLIGVPATDALSNLSYADGKLSFNYVLSEDPYYQWWALYTGNLPAYAYWGKYDTWNYFYNHSSTSKSGKVTWQWGLTSGVIYSLAMFKDPKKSYYYLSDYIEFRAP